MILINELVLWNIHISSSRTNSSCSTCWIELRSMTSAIPTLIGSNIRNGNTCQMSTQPNKNNPKEKRFIFSLLSFPCYHSACFLLAESGSGSIMSLSGASSAALISSMVRCRTKSGLSRHYQKISTKMEEDGAKKNWTLITLVSPARISLRSIMFLGITSAVGFIESSTSRVTFFATESIPEEELVLYMMYDNRQQKMSNFHIHFFCNCTCYCSTRDNCWKSSPRSSVTIDTFMSFPRRCFNFYYRGVLRILFLAQIRECVFWGAPSRWDQ